MDLWVGGNRFFSISGRGLGRQDLASPRPPLLATAQIRLAQNLQSRCKYYSRMGFTDERRYKSWNLSENWGRTGGRSGEVGELWPFSELSAFAESSAGPCGMSRADAGPV